MQRAAILVSAITGLLSIGLASESHAGAQTAQATGAPTRSFEVASVKLNRSTDGNTHMQWSSDRFSTTGMTTKQLIEIAYDIKDFQISGGPSWIDSEKYDIDAKIDESQVADIQKLPLDQRQGQVRLMLQSLLAERFNLKVERETKELPGYALVVAKNGPKLTEAKLPAPGPDGTPTPASRGFGGMSWGRGKITGNGIPISSLADILSRQQEIGGRLVVDETGLKGKYEFTLQWTPEGATQMGGGDATQGSATAPLPEPSGPSIFSALQEQLGLKLESRKGPTETYVIAHIERPSEN